MTILQLKEQLNEKFGEMHQLFVEGKVAEANAILDELTRELYEEMNDGS